MKFTQYLLQHLIPEWVKLYVNFKLLKTYLSIMTILKAFLRDVKQQKSREEYKKIKENVLSDTEMTMKLNRDIENFLNQLQEEVDKFMTFALFKYQDLSGKEIKLKNQCLAMEEYKKSLIIINYSIPNMSLNQTKQQKHQREVHKKNQLQLQEFEDKKGILQDSCFRFYVEIQQLQQFLEINNEAIRKIIKKYKKQELRGLQEEHEEYFNQICSYQIQCKQLIQRLKTLKDTTETQIIQYFYKTQNPKTCREYLRKYTQYNVMSSANIFYFGFFAGFASVFVLLLLVMRYDGYLDPNSDKVFNKLFPCFRGIALFLFYFWMLALDVAGWNYFNINYKIYLGFNFHFSTLSEILKRVTTLSAIFLIAFVLYCSQEEDLGKLAQDLQFFKPQYYPLIIWTITLFYVFYPTKKYFNPQGRRWMYKVLYGTFWYHFIAYESRYTFMADQLCSFNTPMRDLDYTICYYYYLVFVYILIKLFKQQEHQGQCNPRTRFTSALPSTIPYTIKCIHYITRARQKGKFFGTDEMWNFMKTLNAVNVGVWSYIARTDPSYRYIWIFFAVVSTIWQYWWDLKKDFLFFENDSKYKFLRNDLGYNSPKIYYALAVVNLFLRTTWVLSLSPDMYRLFGIKNELFVLMVGILEMMRRFINNFLKMEKEHITNLRNLKTIQDLKYPFTYEKEMNYVQESFRWSVSSFERDNSGFLSFNEALHFDNKPEEVKIYRGVGNQVQSYRESIVSQISKHHNEQLQMIPENLDRYSSKILKDIEMPLIQSHRQSKVYSKKNSTNDLHALSNHKLCVLLDNIQTPCHSRQQSGEQKQPQLQEYQTDDLLKQKIDTAILDRAKKKEKLEQLKIESLKEENRHYKKAIEQAYIFYGIIFK